MKIMLFVVMLYSMDTQLFFPAGHIKKFVFNGGPDFSYFYSLTLNN